MYASFLRLAILTHGRMPKLTWLVFTNSESEWNFAPFIWRALLFVAWFLWGFLSLAASLLLRIWCGRRRSSFRSLIFATAAGSHSVMTETAWVSFWNIVHVPSTLRLSSQRWLSFLFDSWWLILFPEHRSETWSFEWSSPDQYEVLQLSSIVNNSAFHCFEHFLDHTKPTQSENWAKFCNFDLYNPSRIKSEGISLTVNSAWSHLTSKTWTSSFCKLTANRVESPCAVSQAPDALKYSKIMYAICLPRKNRLCCWARCSSTLTLFLEMCLRVEKLFQCRRNHRIKQIEVREISTPHNRSRCHKFASWLCSLNFFNPVHGDLRTSCSWTNLRVRKFTKMHFRNRNSRIIHHTTVRIKFHQYDSTCRLRFGNG